MGARAGPLEPSTTLPVELTDGFASALPVLVRASLALEELGVDSRTLVIALAGAATLGGFLLLNYLIRTGDPDTVVGWDDKRGMTDATVDPSVGGTGDEMSPRLWRLLLVANRIETLAGVTAVLLASALFLFWRGRWPALAGPLLFGGVMFGVMTTLRIVWSRLEAFYTDRQRDGDGRLALAVDTKVVLTMFLALLVLVVGILLVELLLL